jgi:outer membrane protein assembly factor BamA
LRACSLKWFPHFRLLRDTRPNRFYPTNGSLFDFTSDFFSQGLGSKYSFQSYKFTFNKYWSLAKHQILAYNGFNELRGYIAGRYLDRYMVATQLEYRLALPKRLA